VPDPRRYDLDEFARGFADAIWQSSWADAVDRAYEQGTIEERPFGPGDEISEVAPSTPDMALRIAYAVLKEIEERDGKAIAQAYADAAVARYDAPRDERDFGWMIGMRWLGHGTAFPEEAGLARIGHGDVIVDFEDDPFAVEIVNYHPFVHPAPLPRRRRGLFPS